MFWALAAGAVDLRGFTFEQVLQDIQTLNEWALDGRLEVTAISLHAYPFVQDRYALLPHGASIGSGYGPVVVAREELSLDAAARPGDRDPGGEDDRVPGVLRLALGEVAHRELPFDRISEEVASGRAEAGLLIHEGQLTYGADGLEEGARPRRVVAARDRAAAARSGSTWRVATSASGFPTSRPCSATRFARGSRTAREAMSYALALRARDRPRARRPLRRDVRERAHVRLRRRGAAGRRGAASAGRGDRRLPRAGARRLRRLTVALELRTTCERCAAALTADGAAFICSYECTFCAGCSAELGHDCPNCGGELVRRPRRTT